MEQNPGQCWDAARPSWWHRQLKGRELKEEEEDGGGKWRKDRSQGGVKGVEEVVQHQPTNQPTLQSLESEEACMTEKEVEKGFGRGGGGWFCMLMHACMHSRACASLCERYVFVWALREDDVWEMEEMEEWSKKGAIE